MILKGRGEFQYIYFKPNYILCKSDITYMLYDKYICYAVNNFFFVRIILKILILSLFRYNL